MKIHKNLLFICLLIVSCLSFSSCFKAEEVNEAKKEELNSKNKTIKNSLSFVSEIAEESAQSVVSLEISVKGKKKVGLVKRSVNKYGEESFKVQPKVLSFESKVGDGSGFIISKDGYIVTNAHVINPEINGNRVKASKIEVVLYDEKRYTAEVIGADEDSDIAVIKINAENLNPIKWANSSLVKAGEFALTIGSSLGAEQTVGFGIISAVSRKRPEVSKEALVGDLEYIQTYAQINPGNSGGPLINLNGEVIGITSFIQIAPHSPGFAIPSNYAKNIVSTIIKEGHIERASIGISIVPPSDQYADFISLFFGDEEDLKGVLVEGVREDGPADRAGFRRGDLIVSVNDKEMTSPVDFIHKIRSNPKNTNFKIKIKRKTNKGIEEKTINVKSEIANSN